MCGKIGAWKGSPAVPQSFRNACPGSITESCGGVKLRERGPQGSVAVDDGALSLGFLHSRLATRFYEADQLRQMDQNSTLEEVDTIGESPT